MERNEGEEGGREAVRRRMERKVERESIWKRMEIVRRIMMRK